MKTRLSVPLIVIILSGCRRNPNGGSGIDVTDLIPGWAYYIIIVIIILIAIRIGFMFGDYHRKKGGETALGPVNTVVGALMGLMAFLLAFIFGITASRYDAKKNLLLDEVNAIETTYKKAGLIVEPYRSSIRNNLREYVSIRLDLATNNASFDETIKTSERIFNSMWDNAAAYAREQPSNGAVISLMISSLNQLHELEIKRIAVATIYHIQPALWLSLYMLVILGMIGVGYLFGLSNRMNWFLFLILSLALSCVILIIATLDSSGTGRLRNIRINQKPMIDLQMRISE